MYCMQGVAGDESDDEWDGHISWFYGAQATGVPHGHRQTELDPGMDVTMMVVESHDLVDRIHAEAGQGDPGAGQERGHEDNLGDGEGAFAREDPVPLVVEDEPRDMAQHAASRTPSPEPLDTHMASPMYSPSASTNPSSPNSSQGSDGTGDSEDDYYAGGWADSDDEADAAAEALQEAATIPLFAGSRHSRMGTTYVILSGGKLHGCSDAYLDELFRTLSTTILPQPNSLPKTYREAADYLKRLGHAYKSYDVCPNNCRLFRGALKDAVICPECRAPRKKREGKSEVPYKVTRVFPLIPRLKRMFRSPMQAAAMTWWASLQGDGNVMRHVSESEQWKWINRRFMAEFGYDDRNVRLALVTDGFNPNSDKRSTYSIWPILLLNYNIAPWLSTKNYFIMLSVLIPGPRSVTADHFDQFIAPLVDELLELWTTGVYCMDIAAYKESSHFILKAMVVWTIGDFPAYGMLAGCATSGFVGCPICGEGYRSRRSKLLHKNVFCKCARRFLDEDHPMRTDEINFGEVELRNAPVPVSGQEAKANAEERVRWLREEGTPKESDPVRKQGMKRVSDLFRLPYWEVSSQLFISCSVIFLVWIFWAKTPWICHL